MYFFNYSDLGNRTDDIEFKKGKFASAAGISASTVRKMLDGGTVQGEKAEALSAALGFPANRLFTIKQTVSTLSNKTVHEYHELISSVLAQAKKEGLVTQNVAENASPPVPEKIEADYYTPEEVRQFLTAIENEPIYWKTIGNILAYSGERRGEILGMRTQDIFVEQQQIHVVKNLLYDQGTGVYLTSTKGRRSRWIKLPKHVIDLILEYLQWRKENEIEPSEKWEEADLVFIGPDGDPIHPDSLTAWLSSLEKKYNLPHLHAHAFRHTYASILAFGNVDIPSISNALGHANVSTTENIYSHVFDRARERNALVIEDALKLDSSSPN